MSDKYATRREILEIGDGGGTYVEPPRPTKAERPTPSPRSWKLRRSPFLYALLILVPLIGVGGFFAYRSATEIDFNDPRPYYWWRENLTDKYQMVRAYMGWGPFEDEYKQCLASNASRGVIQTDAQRHCVEQHTIPGWCVSSSVNGEMTMSAHEWKLTGTLSNESHTRVIGPRSKDWHCSMDYRPVVILREEFYRMNDNGEALGTYYSYTRIGPKEEKSIVADRSEIVPSATKLDRNSEYNRLRVVLVPSPR